MMESAAGKAAERSGRNESWGAILSDRLVRAVVLWPRCGINGRAVRDVLTSCAAGRMSDRNSIVEGMC